MKIVPIEMKCSFNMSKQTVYCYVSSNGVVISNGCDVMVGGEQCSSCLKRSAAMVKEQLGGGLSKFSLQEP